MSNKSPHPGGRPEKPYDPEIASLICYHLSNGWSLKRIQNTIKEVPSFYCIYKWLEEVPEFSEKYAKARKYQADTYLDDLIEIGRDGTEDYIVSAEGVKVNNWAINRARLLSDNIKFTMARLHPKKYGDRQIVEHEGSQPISLHVEASRKESRLDYEQRKRLELERKAIATNNIVKDDQVIDPKLTNGND